MRRRIETDERDSTNRASFRCPCCFSTFTDLEANQLFDPMTGMGQHLHSVLYCDLIWPQQIFYIYLKIKEENIKFNLYIIKIVCWLIISVIFFPSDLRTTSRTLILNENLQSRCAMQVYSGVKSIYFLNKIQQKLYTECQPETRKRSNRYITVEICCKCRFLHLLRLIII